MINSPICGDRLGKIVGEAVCALLPGPVAVSRSWLGFEQCGVGYKGTNSRHVVKILISMVHFIPFQVAEQFRSAGHLAIQSEAKA